MTFPPLSRRYLLRGLSACAGLSLVAGFGTTRVQAAQGRLVIVTSYPQEVISRYLDAFAKIAPETRVDVVWHSGDDARDYLLGEGRGKVDVYWTPSVRTFAELRDKGALAKLDIDHSGLPGRIGHQWISDPEGHFEASEIAGYGLVLNPAILAQKNLPEPGDWSDLANPVYAGQVAMPVPSRIGFAPTITEIILQSQGWDKGWALLAGIAGNASLKAGRGEEPLSPVAKGDLAVGMTIDFFASQAIAKGAPLKFVYPKANAFEPANIAIPTEAANPAAALDFVNFVLSEAGQKLLIDVNLRRLAIRPAVYQEAPAGTFDPWLPETAEALSFDSGKFIARRDIDNALFDRVIYEPREPRAGLWSQWRQASARPDLSPKARAILDQAHDRLTSIPIGEAEAERLAPAFIGRRREGGETKPEAVAAEAAWDQAIQKNLAQAADLLTSVEPA